MIRYTLQYMNMRYLMEHREDLMNSAVENVWHTCKVMLTREKGSDAVQNKCNECGYCAHRDEVHNA